MSIYVDTLFEFGWVMYGKRVPSCHMFTDELDLTSLHEMARRIGLRRTYFQNTDTPHYDLVKSKRNLAVRYGALEIDWREAVAIWKKRKENLTKEKI